MLEYAVSKEIRIAAVFYGGSSLAIYENGVAQELLRLVRATAANPGALLSNLELVYADLAHAAGNRESQAINQRVSGPAPAAEVPRPVRFVVDVLSGTSAGGINAVYLAKALARGGDLAALRDLWFQQADFDLLLNDTGSKQGGVEERIRLKRPPTSLLNSHRMYIELFQALQLMDVNGVPLASRLDLFTTATDLDGVGTPIRLSFQEATERVHRFALHFSFRAGGVDDFTREDNALLTFGARLHVFVSSCFRAPCALRTLTNSCP